MNASIEVFRDLYLRGSLTKRDDLGRALIAAAEDPWYYDPDRSGMINRNTPDANILAFGRTASEDLRAARLTLWSQDGGYYVPNIVPIGGEGLSIAQYNAILSDFVERIVRPVASRFNFEIDLTKVHQDLEDWTSPEAANKLRVFSGAANKSTGASHPMDKLRWFDFIIAVHKSGKAISTDRLIRWLNEIEGWDEESAHELASQYENGLGLLQRYERR